MLVFLQRHAPALWLLLMALAGLALGSLTATLIGLSLGPAPAAVGPQRVDAAPPKTKTLNDYALITQRNIFDSTAPAASLAAAGKTAEAKAATPKVELKLVGTVTGGEEDSLALIEAAKALKAYRLGDLVPGDGRLVEISRNIVRIDYADGSFSILPLYQDEGPRRATAAAPLEVSQTGIRALGENRWALDAALIDETRANLGEVLKSARMEPRLVEGQTEGFVVAMVRPGSLLGRMGIRRGDVVLQVNGMPLDSPEKALQIFQQLREARSLTVDLERDGEPTRFEYELN